MYAFCILFLYYELWSMIVVPSPLLSFQYLNKPRQILMVTQAKLCNAGLCILGGFFNEACVLSCTLFPSHILVVQTSPVMIIDDFVV